MEPWMRGTYGELDPLRRAVVHALELAVEDVAGLGELMEESMFARPFGVASVAFHLRHMVRSLDRLLTYAEGGMLSAAQLEALGTEHDAGDVADVVAEFREGMERAMLRVRAVAPEVYAEARGIGRKRLPTTVAGLLIHCAEHTQRHAGQMVTTARIVRGMAAASNDAEGTA